MKDFSINIAEDGGTIQVGDKTYQVTLITPAEQELKPVEGKWYRRVKEGNNCFEENKWYQCEDEVIIPKIETYLVSNYFEAFDLSTPLDFDPETLVGKTLEWAGGVKVVVTKTEWPFLIGSYETTKAYIGDLIGVFDEIKKGYTKILDPEPTLTVPENVEFVIWGYDFTLAYNGLILSPIENGLGFMLIDKLDCLDPIKFLNLVPCPIKSLKLIPCNIDEVKNGEWVVNEERKHKSFHYRLKTEKGWVSFNGSGEYPIIIDSGLSDSINWLKVVQG